MKGTEVRTDVSPQPFVAVGDGRTAEQRTAAAMDAQLEQMAASCNTNGVKDARWNTAALALLGARRLFRDLMHDDDRRRS